ncbi:hypothetical protein ACFT7S_10450 [Streptomyces sp. NPDC057136]|uniref:hypothetical protein n=1 Tax=Streptomyces sp. NPDC057136 TaxID=3346029 RepID=UPI0036335DDC
MLGASVMEYHLLHPSVRMFRICATCWRPRCCAGCSPRSGTACGLNRALFAQGHIPQPSNEQQHLFTLFSVGGIVAITRLAFIPPRGIV